MPMMQGSWSCQCPWCKGFDPDTRVLISKPMTAIVATYKYARTPWCCSLIWGALTCHSVWWITVTSRSRDIYFSNASWRNVNNQSHWQTLYDRYCPSTWYVSKHVFALCYKASLCIWCMSKITCLPSVLGYASGLYFIVYMLLLCRELFLNWAHIVFCYWCRFLSVHVCSCTSASATAWRLTLPGVIIPCQGMLSSFTYFGIT